MQQDAKRETAMQRESLAASLNLHNKEGKKRDNLSPPRGASKQGSWSHADRATATKEVRRERGILSYRREMRDFVFLEQSRANEVIRYRTYRPRGDSLRSYQP